MPISGSRTLIMLLALVLLASGAYGMQWSTATSAGEISSSNANSLSVSNLATVSGNTIMDGGNSKSKFLVQNAGDAHGDWQITNANGDTAQVKVDVTGNLGGPSTLDGGTDSYGTTVEAYGNLRAVAETDINAYATAYKGNQIVKTSLYNLPGETNPGSLNIRTLILDATADPSLLSATLDGTRIAAGGILRTETLSQSDLSNKYDFGRIIDTPSSLRIRDTATISRGTNVISVADMNTLNPSGAISLSDDRIVAGNERIVSLSSSDMPGIVSSSTNAMINQMVGLAANSATIILSPGTFKENVAIDKSLTINGAGSSATKIDGTWTTGSLFTIGKNNPNIYVALNGMELTKSNSQDGAVDNYANPSSGYGLVLTNSKVDYNTGSASAGLCNYGSASVYNTVFDHNTATQAGSQGGAIYTSRKLNVDTCIFTNNYASLGGALFDAAPVGTLVEVKNSQFQNNGWTTTGPAQTTNCGGAIAVYSGSPISVSDTTISGNKALVGAGIGSYGTVTLSGTNSITGNTATNMGGGIYNHNTGTVSATSGMTTISGNIAPINKGGGIYNKGTVHSGTPSHLTVTGNTGGNVAGNPIVP